MKMRTTQPNPDSRQGWWVAAPLLGLLFVLPGCVSSTLWDVDRGLTNQKGDPIDFQVTTAGGVHFLFDLFPLFGDGTVHNSLKHFQEAALANNAAGIRIVETDTTVYWWVLPPLSFIFPVVVSRVTGDLQFEPGTAPVKSKVL